jgi:pimeloyl-ACP methyl ester carboxylesterase
MTSQTTTRSLRSADGTSIAFDRIGTGPPLVLVDAASCFRGFGPMGPLAEALAPDFTVFTYDRRGRGESTDTPPYAVEREVEDLGAVIEAAGGSAFVHGFSSGAVLALHAAAHGLPIAKMTLLEPPIELEGPDPSEPDLGAEIAALVAEGRRGDAVEHFNRSIGVPPEMVAGLRDAPFWPKLEALAHTLVYDTVITSSLPAERLSAIGTPALVIVSGGSDKRLLGWAEGVSEALPNASLRTLAGEWHGVPTEDLAAALAGFFGDAEDEAQPSNTVSLG